MLSVFLSSSPSSLSSSSSSSSSGVKQNVSRCPKKSLEFVVIVRRNELAYVDIPLAVDEDGDLENDYKISNVLFYLYKMLIFICIYMIYVINCCSYVCDFKNYE